MLGDPQVKAKENPFYSNAFSEVSFTIGAEATNAITVTAKVKTPRLNSVGVRTGFIAYISTDAEGDNITSAAPNGGVVNAGKGVTIPLVSDKAFQMVTDVNGEVSITITESTAKTFYLIVVTPAGLLVASSAITFA